MDQYKDLYTKALAAMKQNIFYRPMTPTHADILFPGVTISDGKTPLENLPIEGKVEHLGCFAGGMVALAAKAFASKEDLKTAQQLVEGCLWAYENMHMGIMPEIMHLAPCRDPGFCPWGEELWYNTIKASYEDEMPTQSRIDQERLLPGITKIDDRRYILR